MAILAPILAFIGQQLGKLVQMALGWASLLLFGRVPQSKSLLLSIVALASLAWLVVVVGIVLPAVGAFLLAAVPAQDFIGESWLRIIMLALAVLLPLGVGVGGYFLIDSADRPKDPGGTLVQVLRGYPYTAVLALVLVVLILIAPIFKLRSIVKRWEDAHIPILVQPGGYETVTRDIESAVDRAGLDLTQVPAPGILEVPSKLLARIGGASVRRLVPDRLFALRGRDLEVTIHPSDVAMAGSKASVARAHAAIASTITFTAAYLTASEESQKVEDLLLKISRSESVDAARALQHVDRLLARLVVPHEEWEVLYRQRLQVEREIGRRERALEARPGFIDKLVSALGRRDETSS